VTATTDAGIADAVAAILVAPGPKACSRIFGNTIAKFDVDTFACGEIDLAERARTVFYAIAWPAAWREFYLSSGMLERDPLIEALNHRREPFTWSELRRDRKFSACGAKALQLCADHGWIEGLAVPIPRGDHRFGLVSLVCRGRHFDANEKALLSMLSLCFHERLRNLAPTHGFALPPVGLSQREIDCLKLIARGATDRDIGRTLGISKATAHEHIENAKSKLKVSTRAGAIAIAVSLAIVAP
jgi:LuxR family transcriptional regulator, quorum-sensing system regulator BjaR1